MFSLKDFTHPVSSSPRRIVVGFCIIAFWAVLVTFTQPVVAAPRGQGALAANTATPSHTPTATFTASATITPIYIPHIIINEVDWAGNLGTSNYVDQWMELYNPPDSPMVVLDGWQLRSKDGSVLIKLSGNVAPGTFYLIERGDGKSIKDTNNNVVTPNLTYSGALLPYWVGSGGALQLVDGEGFVVDSANDSGNIWPAGNATTRCSMERSRPDIADGVPGAWITNNGRFIFAHSRDGSNICGSPGWPNWAYSVTATASLTPTATRTSTPLPSKTPKGFLTHTPTRTPNLTLPSSIVINEFLTQPRFDWNGDGKTDIGDEFVELINLSSQPVSISGWRLDELGNGSTGYSIGSVIMQPKTHMVFFESQTGLLLSNGGGTLRLLKSGGQVSDAFTYGVIETPDQSWCRLPDGANTWVFGCVPTIGTANRLAESAFVGNQIDAPICSSTKLPENVALAECNPIGLSIWNSSLWENPLSDYPRYLDMDLQTYIMQ